MTNARAWQKALVLTAPAVVFGFLVATQWATLAAPGSRDVGIRYIDPLSGSVTRLQDEQTALKTELADLRQKLDDLQRAATTQGGTARELQAHLDDLRAAAGLTEQRGEGVIVTLDAVRAPGAKDERQVCFAPDLTDIVNAGWRGGATAVAINAERIVASSSVYCVGSTIVVNGSIVAAPLAVSMVGAPGPILQAMDDPAQLRDLKKRRDELAVDLRVTRSPLVTVPSYTGPLAVRSVLPR